MFIKTLPLFLALFLLASCGSDDGGGQGSVVPAQPGNNTAASPQAGTPAPATVPTTSSGTSGARLNPPHGEPGHICEIGVGEPLPEDGSTPMVTSSPAPPGLDFSTTVVPPPSGTPSMGGGAVGSGQPNPPHGEPGHVCEIPVGDPLP